MPVAILGREGDRGSRAPPVKYPPVAHQTLSHGYVVRTVCDRDNAQICFFTAYTSVREYVFFTFFQISKKTWLYVLFWNDVSKSRKKVTKSIKFAECL